MSATSLLAGLAHFLVSLAIFSFGLKGCFLTGSIFLHFMLCIVLLLGLSLPGLFFCFPSLSFFFPFLPLQVLDPGDVGLSGHLVPLSQDVHLHLKIM